MLSLQRRTISEAWGLLSSRDLDQWVIKGTMKYLKTCSRSTGGTDDAGMTSASLSGSVDRTSICGVNGDYSSEGEKWYKRVSEADKGEAEIDDLCPWCY